METKLWAPRQEYTNEERALRIRLRRTNKLFAFLRTYRHEFFDEGFEAEPAQMYRWTGAGKEPVPVTPVVMGVLLQQYVGASDAEAVELKVVDKRWELALGRLESRTRAFSQGAFWDFRERLIRHDMDLRLMERTRELVRKAKGARVNNSIGPGSLAPEGTPGNASLGETRSVERLSY